MRILIVEDELTSRTVLTKTLAQFGERDYAANDLETIQLFNAAFEENNPYGLICLNIMMPHMDGKEALGEIRRIEKEAGITKADEVKIIMTTAIDDPQTVVETFSEGASAYLVQPIQVSELLDEIRGFGMLPEGEQE